ncbi:MAG: hypothetical protein C5S49_06045 [Candidatus Methanogaster sp.]|nr:MAG: hypothetical protein C5S49_06045 [ANME-2 cluster archaeon]
MKTECMELDEAMNIPIYPRAGERLGSFLGLFQFEWFLNIQMPDDILCRFVPIVCRLDDQRNLLAGLRRIRNLLG